jgi:FtsH-binding integral membrane protein
VATIANATVLLVSIGWRGFGVSEPVWAAVMIAAGFLIGTAVMLKNKDKAYGLVLIWAFFGILMKHIRSNGFDGQYPLVITTAGSCVALLVCVEIFLFLKKRKSSI